MPATSSWPQPPLPNQLQPASLDLRLGARAYRVRASFLPGAGTVIADKLADLQAARDRPDQGRRAGDGLRLYRAAAGEHGAARSSRRRHQPQELDRPARRVHARDRRRRRRLRPDPRRLSRRALRRDLPADLPDRGAQGLAPVADPLPRGAAEDSDTLAGRAASAREAGLHRAGQHRRRHRPVGGPDRRQDRPRRLPRQAAHRHRRRRCAGLVRRARLLGADPRCASPGA